MASNVVQSTYTWRIINVSKIHASTGIMESRRDNGLFISLFEKVEATSDFLGEEIELKGLLLLVIPTV